MQLAIVMPMNTDVFADYPTPHGHSPGHSYSIAVVYCLLENIELEYHLLLIFIISFS